ncbi:MAG: DUF1015 domain-containing protein [Deltaproteobacteria bacterium]|nr:DUF1015 domain-containing protein [Deltaproteobacteria bacterium]
MAEIMPLKAVVYNPAAVRDMNKVMAPPYDVISPAYQDELYARDPHNFVKIDLNKTGPSDNEGNDRYSRASALLKDWLASNVLARDERPAVYFYTQTYKLKDGARQTRKGFVALARLEEFGKGGIHPHEKTLSGPKADRLRLMQTTNANLSCIFSLYSEPSLGINRLLEGAIKDAAPIIDVKDDDAIENRLWRIDDPAVIAKTVEAMKDKPLFIADGHHRYETALNYRREELAKTKNPTGREAYNYIMMYFSNMDDEGMTIWPTHRVIRGLAGFDAKAFIGQCNPYFDLEEMPCAPDNGETARKEFLNKVEKNGKKAIAFGLYMRGADAYYVLTLRSKDVMDKVFGPGIPDVFKALDVTVLHSLILSKMLGIGQEAQEKQLNLVYVKNSEEAIDGAKKDNNQMAFILNPTRIEQVKAVALAGHVMPQKSTYFYPKLLSGLTINLLDGEVEGTGERV